MLKRLCSLLLAAAFAFGLAACTKMPGGSQDDILTQTVLSEGKIPVTVLVKYAFSINTFEKAAEEKFPNLDIIQVGNYTSDMGIAEYEARLAHGDITDLVLTWPLEVGEPYWEDRLMDLSSLSFTNRYNTSRLNKIARDGKLYYLPGPSQLRGIIYNKTLFEEMEWEIPSNFEGFLALCDEIEKSGTRALQLGLKDTEVLDTAFVGFSYADCFSKPEDAQWLSDYDSGVGSFGDHFGSALETFQTLIDRGILEKNDLNVSYSDREQMLFTRECAMVEDSVLMARMGFALTGSTDEFALMPFFNPDSGGDWARLYPVCYIGVDRRLADAKNKEKYKLVMKLLEYISTPEGQTALAGDTDAVFSSLNDTEPPNVPEIHDLLPALAHGRYAAFPTLKNAQNALREGLAGMVAGELTASEVSKMVDKENASPPLADSPEVLGSATADFSLIETGNFITDSMRAQSGCEIALFLDNGKDGKCNGKGICARLYKGDLTAVDVQRLMPDLKYGEKGDLRKVTMTGEKLLATLEYSIPINNEQTGWFYYFSGLRMEFAPAAEPGKRIRKITDDKNQPIDPQRVYSVAIMDDSVPMDTTLSVEETGLTISRVLTDAITSSKSIAPSGDNRFIVCQP